jgi:hypothetical protein
VGRSKDGDFENQQRMSLDRQRVFGEMVSQLKDPDIFRYRPWQADLITAEQMRSQISRAIAEQGYWETYAEMRMGAGTTVRLELLSGPERYLVSAEFRIRMSGEYDTLDDALAAGSLFSEVLWQLVDNGGLDPVR